MKHDYSPMTFSDDAAVNAVVLHNRDYHTLCVIQDASGYSSAEGLAQWVRQGKSFAIEPKWPCCRGEAWYRAQAARDIDFMMTTLPIDSVPVSIPTWGEIKGKAHLYCTARLRSTGEYVRLAGVRSFVDGCELSEPVFACKVTGFAGIEHRATDELCDFCL